VVVGRRALEIWAQAGGTKRVTDARLRLINRRLDGIR
jgi:hypothetical protein